MRNLKVLILSLAFTLLFVSASKVSPSASLYMPDQSPSAVISGINSYRAANGYYSYTQNNTLMRIAQAQADYQASINTVTHDGPGGTRPINRAYNANYGNGNKVFVSEIIYGGYGADVSTAIEWWKNSGIHNDQMLASTYVQIGAGVATDGEWTYFVAVMGWVTGIDKPADANPSSPAGDTTSDNNEDSNDDNDTTGYIPAVPVVQATPHEDGSVIHIIRSGQALWTVSVVYDVPLETILELNGLSESAWIQPGDEIIVKLPHTPTPTASNTPPPPKVPQPTNTPTHTPLAIAKNIESSEPQKNSEENKSSNNDMSAASGTNNQNARWIVLLAFAMLMIVIVGSMFMQKPTKRPDQDNDVVR